MTEFEIEIYRTFGTKSACNEYMGWSPSAISKIVNGTRHLKANEINKLAEKMEISSMERFKAIFFNIGLPNGNKGEQP